MDSEIENDDLGWLSRNVNWILFGGIFLMIISPVVITQPAYFTFFGLTSVDQIGSTIGGITAPVISTVSAILVYVAFKSQIKANDIQKKALETEKSKRAIESTFNTVLSELNWVSEEYNKINYDGIVGLRSVDTLFEKTIIHRRTGKLIEEGNFENNFEKYLEQQFELFKNLTDEDKQDIIYLYQNIINLLGYLKEMLYSTKEIDNKQYKKILSNKILFIYRNYSKKYKSKFLNELHVVVQIIEETPERVNEILSFEDSDIEWLRAQRFFN